MKIVALNVAKPKVIEYRGEQVSTGIYKSPVQGAFRVRATNIDGDGQADLTVHGGPHKAVYAFPSEHYAAYQEALGQEPYDYGQFGENLTTEGMLETAVRIGDRYRMGEAVL
jgi:MOSC domain-containing protein YiiM